MDCNLRSLGSFGTYKRNKTYGRAKTVNEMNWTLPCQRRCSPPDAFAWRALVADIVVQSMEKLAFPGNHCGNRIVNLLQDCSVVTRYCGRHIVRQIWLQPVLVGSMYSHFMLFTAVCWRCCKHASGPLRHRPVSRRVHAVNATQHPLTFSQINA